MSDTTGFLPFAFDTYGTDKGGAVVGKVYEDHNTGYKYIFCQAHTVLTNDTTAIGEIAVQQSATAKGVATNRATGSLDATYPIALGVITSVCPESTATTTYYFWALKEGYVATLLNDGTDQTAGFNLYPVAADPCSCKGIAGTTTSDNGVIQSIFGRAATTVTGTNSTAFVKFKDI